MSSSFVASSQRLWEAWRLSKAYHSRPSEIFGVDHPVQALFFDRAVYMFGTQVEADMDQASQKAKKSTQANAARLRALNKWLGIEHGAFRTPTITR